ncbi:MAG: ATP-binding cassette domain-containing protein [Gemmatimonadaceae bacterium]
MIEATGLHAQVGDFVLSDVTFTVPRGSYGVVIGPAGSGKTTLLETIAGIIPQRGGRLRLSGARGEARDAAGIPPERRRIGFVYQLGYLFPHLSVAENIAYGASEPAAAVEVASRLGAAELWGRAIRGLSGGERQLVGVERGIASRPTALFPPTPFTPLAPRRLLRVRH